VSPPLADALHRRSVLSPSKDPRELGRLGGDPVGGQHEAREVLRNIRARWGAGVVVRVREPFGGHGAIVLLDPSAANSSRIKPAFGSRADCGTGVPISRLTASLVGAGGGG
jgi:hypothetical protein